MNKIYTTTHSSRVVPIIVVSSTIEKNPQASWNEMLRAEYFLLIRDEEDILHSRRFRMSTFTRIEYPFSLDEDLILGLSYEWAKEDWFQYVISVLVKKDPTIVHTPFHEFREVDCRILLMQHLMSRFRAELDLICQETSDYALSQYLSNLHSLPPVTTSAIDDGQS